MGRYAKFFGFLNKSKGGFIFVLDVCFLSILVGMVLFAIISYLIDPAWMIEVFSMTPAHCFEEVLDDTI